MKIKCRAKLSPHCYDGTECVTVYGEDTMSDDGLFDGESVICDACYIAGGQPALAFPASRLEVVAFVDRHMGIVNRNVIEGRLVEDDD